ncbi:MAG: LytTR family transcriptional regulator DNA-binding domain-containing protein [Bacteroidetes bacterium]|nr:LytTR family transcriptional regulator DNA-binding domain-containing protein [Bacteroidota bacterium]
MPTEQEKINILVVEDEAIVAMDLAQGLERDGYAVAGIADCAEEALQIFGQQPIDIVLMDIHIAGKKDGIETAAELMRVRRVPLIYLTAFTDAGTIEKAKHTYPSAYLAKPYHLTNVRIAIELAISNFAVARQPGGGKVVPLESHGTQGAVEPADKEAILQMNDCIFVKSNYAFVKIRLPDILYLAAENNHVRLATADRQLLLRMSLGLLLEKIDFKPLVRIHRSFAVNMNAIQSFTDQEVTINKTPLPIGRSYKEEFLKNFDFR